MTQTPEQSFTVWDVAADLRKLMMPWRIMQVSIV